MEPNLANNLSQGLESNDAAPSRTKYHVCVIGAGISGLRCADVLLQHGIQVTILEARNRIGGRVHQSDKLGYLIDIGPNWIHTSGDNPLLDLAKETNTPLHVWNEKIRVFNRNGDAIPEDKAKELSDLRWELIEEAFPYSLKHKHEISANDSLYDFLMRRTLEEGLSSEDSQLLLDMSHMWGCYTGDSIRKQSLKFAFLEDCCGGEECVVTSTFTAILERIATPALARAEIHVNELVVRIESCSLPFPKVSITTAKGKKYQFDAVVVTTPLGWLKRHSAAFEPPLPPELKHAISAISVGHLEKIYVNFPRAFWRSNLSSSSNSAEGTEDSCPGYTNWIAPSYASDTNPNAWPQEAYDLSAYAAPNTHPTLLFYTYGDCSAHITSHVYNQPRSVQDAFLKSFFEPYYSRLSGYDSSDPTCQPKAFLATTWQFDELAGFGSYCNFQVGVENAEEYVERIRIGCPERLIWFAGEHAAPEEEMGTAAGAYLSGDAAARKAVEALRILDKSVGC